MDFSEEEPLIQVLRKNNRIRREAEKRLRRVLEDQTKRMDLMFIALCDKDTDAQNAIQEIWERGGLTCSPDDVQSIIDLTVEALHALKSNTRNTESQQGCTNYR
jgi:hypothetical protein